MGPLDRAVSASTRTLLPLRSARGAYYVAVRRRGAMSLSQAEFYGDASQPFAFETQDDDAPSQSQARKLVATAHTTARAVQPRTRLREPT